MTSTAAPASAPELPPAPSPATLGRLAVFLDLDGVLAPIAPTPDGVAPSPRRTDVLRRLIVRLGGRVAVLSGRPIVEIDRLCEGAVTCVSGVHGLERRRPDGAIERAAAAEGIGPAVAALEAFARPRPGLFVEDKGLAAGLHYRLAPQHSGAALDLARDLAAEHDLTLQPGHMIAELKTPGADKGVALAAFMTEAPFAGAAPVMLGDDQTDEFGFRAAESRGGFGVLVGPPRPTAARYNLTDVAAVLDWLDTLEETG